MTEIQDAAYFARLHALSGLLPRMWMERQSAEDASQVVEEVLDRFAEPLQLELYHGLQLVLLGLLQGETMTADAKGVKEWWSRLLKIARRLHENDLITVALKVDALADLVSMAAILDAKFSERLDVRSPEIVSTLKLLDTQEPVTPGSHWVAMRPYVRELRDAHLKGLLTVTGFGGDAVYALTPAGRSVLAGL